MAISIPLPNLGRSKEATAHHYPFRIGIQTLEFMQGSLFHSTLVDVAAGAYVQQPEGLANIERVFMGKLDSKEIYDEAWKILNKYQAVFERIPFQAVLIAMNSHWDWYARKLVDFILFARQDLRQPALEKGNEKRLARFFSLPIGEQLEVIRVAAGINLVLTAEEIADFQEMALVRNLGLHNRWEVDERYLKRTANKNFQFGELRIVESEEIHRWHKAFIKVVQLSHVEVAVAFVNASDYP